MTQNMALELGKRLETEIRDLASQRDFSSPDKFLKALIRGEVAECSHCQTCQLRLQGALLMLRGTLDRSAAPVVLDGSALL